MIKMKKTTCLVKYEAGLSVISIPLPRFLAFVYPIKLISPNSIAVLLQKNDGVIDVMRLSSKILLIHSENIRSRWKTKLLNFSIVRRICIVSMMIQTIIPATFMELLLKNFTAHQSLIKMILHQIRLPSYFNSLLSSFVQDFEASC